MYDYVIAGGGSAGCVLANRLSADPKNKVCLIEAGPADTSPLVRMPGGVIGLMRSNSHNWQFWTAPEKHCGGRSMYWPRGKTLGGSSAINAMVAIRGHAQDYDLWESQGNKGWAFKDVLPLFKAMENYEPGAAGELSDEEREYHGSGGNLNVAERRHTNPLSAAFVQAALQAGHRPTPDFNGAQQEGCGMYRAYQKGGERCSNAAAFLRGAEPRPNLTILTGAQVTRVLFEGKRAAGVRYCKDGLYYDVIAQREVILAAGTVGSPHLLLLSGVGPAAELKPHDVDVVQDLPGVGKNLQDHLDILVSTRAKNRLPLSFHPLSLLRSLAALFRYIFRRQGELTSNIAEAGVFLKSRPEEPLPDLQMHFVPLANAYHGLDLSKVIKTYSYSVMICDLRPLSRGEITLNSGDPLAPPRIQPNYLSHARDLDRLVAGIRKAREILSQTAFDPHRAEEVEPGPQVQTDEQLRDWVRQHAETVYHPVGSCKMGSDAMAVVDARLRVRGVKNLRVVDASIMPTLVGGNTNGPATMIGEKGARMILEDALAPAQAEDAPVYAVAA